MHQENDFPTFVYYQHSERLKYDNLTTKMVKMSLKRTKIMYYFQNIFCKFDFKTAFDITNIFIHQTF